MKEVCPWWWYLLWHTSDIRKKRKSFLNACNALNGCRKSFRIKDLHQIKNNLFFQKLTSRLLDPKSLQRMVIILSNTIRGTRWIHNKCVSVHSILHKKYMSIKGIFHNKKNYFVLGNNVLFPFQMFCASKILSASWRGENIGSESCERSIHFWSIQQPYVRKMSNNGS